MRNERRFTIKEEASNLDGKFDFINKTLEKVVERLDHIERKPQWENQSQIRNPNYRKNNNPGKGKEPSPD